MTRSPARRAAKPAAVSHEPVETRIAFVGNDGDGIGTHPDGSRLYVPLTVPGDFVRVRPSARRGDGWAAEQDTILEPGPGRRTPECVHFGVCGGCTSQHWDEASYLDWKTGRLIAALQRAGFDEPPAAPIVRVPLGRAAGWTWPCAACKAESLPGCTGRAAGRSST